MRKKSHISLARYIVNNMEDNDLKKHKLSFYIGSVLPDIKPSFVYKRHEMDGTYPDIRRHIERLSEGRKLVEKKKGRKYYMDLGQISHYLADYFTYPHNKIYPGSLKDHCSYEEKLKRDLRRYIRTDAAKPHKADHLEFNSARNLCDFIQKSHDDYLVRKHDVEDDIHHIVEANRIRTETDLLIDTYHVRHLVFDFTETEFMDSSGIGVIIGRCKNLGYSGGDVSACHLNERVDKIFTVSGLKKIIQVKE